MVAATVVAVGPAPTAVAGGTVVAVAVAPAAVVDSYTAPAVGYTTRVWIIASQESIQVGRRCHRALFCVPPSYTRP